MLLPYKYHKHRIEGIMHFVNYIFLQVVCRAPKLPNATFDSRLNIGNYQWIFHPQYFKYIREPLAEIYLILKQKPRAAKLLRRAVLNNNRIYELCANKLQPVTYDEIGASYPELVGPIRLFCDKLYDEFAETEFAKEHFSDLRTYYDSVVENDTLCHCCGVGMVLNKFHAHRSALDHYLPRSIYPFVSINCKNLVPICDVCNSKYKLAENTLFVLDELHRPRRVRAFFPFRADPPDIKIELNLKAVGDLPQLVREKIDLKLLGGTYQDAVDNWCRIFGIEDNYKAIYSSKSINEWAEDVLLAKERNPEEYQMIRRNVKKRPFNDQNFLRISVFDYLDRIEEEKKRFIDKL